MRSRSLASTRVTDLDLSQAVAEEQQRVHQATATDTKQPEEQLASQLTIGRSSTTLNLEDNSQGEHPDSNTESSDSSSSDSDAEDGDRSGSSDSETAKTNIRENNLSCVHNVQVSPDGSCIFTTDYNREFSVYPIDSDISSTTFTRSLKPYAKFKSANPIWSFAVNPVFDWQDPNTTHVLLGRRDSYITLHNALWDITQWSDEFVQEELRSGPVNISKPLQSYKLIDTLTEEVIAPLSLAYSQDGTHFYAGFEHGIAQFDLEIPSEPIHTIATIPSKRNKAKGGGRGFKGVISALAVSPEVSLFHELIAAGSRTREVGVYSALNGQAVTHISLPGQIHGQRYSIEGMRPQTGNGVSQLNWSSCGRYLYVAERRSDAILIYDMRNFSQCLGFCVGRKAMTNQKMSFDICAGEALHARGIKGVEHEVWAGGTDGKVRCWTDPFLKQGAVEADDVMEVYEASLPVVSTLIHPSEALLVTGCGTRRLGQAVDLRDGERRSEGRKAYQWGSVDVIGLERSKD